MKREEAKIRYGQNLKRLRLAKGMSQEELAKALGYTNRSSINKIEVGRSNIPTDKIARTAEVLGVSPLELFKDDDIDLNFGEELEKEIIETLENTATQAKSEFKEKTWNVSVEGPYIVEFPEIDGKNRKLMKIIKELSPESMDELITFAEYLRSKQDKEKKNERA